jgi:tripeptidyl-peptidase-1
VALADAALEGWAADHDGGPAAEGSVSVVVALRLPSAGVERLHAALDNPRQLRWSDQQLSSALAPPGAALDAVRRWLLVGGGRVTSETPRFVVVEVDAAAAARCFGVKLRSYSHHASGRRTLVAAERIHVPREIKPLVDFVGGMDRPPRVTRDSSHSPAVATVDGAALKITPAVIHELYNVPETTPASSNIQGIAAFNNESFTPTDLARFQDLMGLRHVPVNHTVGPATFPKGATAEGSLDVQYIMGVSPFVPTVVWATAGQRFDPDDGKYDNEPFLKWIVNISAAAAEPIPHIFSLSYQDYEDTCAPAYMDRLNTEFAALAMRGTTLVTGSGDWGTGCSKADNATFRADFPSSSPYVVSTGATTFPSGGGGAVKGQEIGVTFSSGGFSRHFPMPSYQKLVSAARTPVVVRTSAQSHTDREFRLRLH